MRLVRLSANMPTFRTVAFNRGLSLVVAEQRTPKNNRTKTYNGVGKSLMLEIMHFCMGSNSNKAFQKHLGGWVFYLEVEVDGKRHVIARSTDNPKGISINEKTVSLTGLRDFLQKACFEIPPDIPGLSFRSLISRFARSGRGAYNSFFFGDGMEQRNAYEAMLRNAFLLGLDLHLAKKKFDLRKREKSLEETMSQLENEPLFSEVFTQDKVDIELTALKEQEKKLRGDLQSFRVAEDYHDIEKDANAVKRELDRLRRDSVKVEEAIAQIDRSLQTRGDLPKEKVFQLYQEAQLSFPDQVKRRVDEVLEFQRDLQQRRVYRLSRERQDLERQRRQTLEQTAEKSRQLDARLKYLSEHRALDEYVAVSNELAEIQKQIAKLEDAKALREKVNKELRRIVLELADQNIITDEYLESADPLISEATSAFREYARELYGNRPSGLSVANDDGENQQRYRIEAHISADAAEGINEAKIFCYDMMILQLRRGHRVDFLAHDSTLFGPIDPRQRLSMFRIVDRKCRELGVQYIATLNLHDITSLAHQTDSDADEIAQLFSEPSVVLRLTDETPQSKLLGIDIDMNYME